MYSSLFRLLETWKLYFLAKDFSWNYFLRWYCALELLWQHQAWSIEFALLFGMKLICISIESYLIVFQSILASSYLWFIYTTSTKFHRKHISSLLMFKHFLPKRGSKVIKPQYISLSWFYFISLLTVFTILSWNLAILLRFSSISVFALVTMWCIYWNIRGEYFTFKVRDPAFYLRCNNHPSIGSNWCLNTMSWTDSYHNLRPVLFFTFSWLERNSWIAETSLHPTAQLFNQKCKS